MKVIVKDLAKTFPDGTRVLESVNFTIGSGEGVALLGANGCGKSTLLRCMLGLEPVSAGEVTIDGVPVHKAGGRQLRGLRTRIGSVWQQFNLVGNLSVHQNVLFRRLGADGLIGSLALTAPKAARDKAMACLDRVGLAHLAARRTDRLSGGQQQRVAIARMLMQDAGIVFADEPVASLDPKAGREVMDLLFEIVRERRLTVICVLHQLELAREYADRVIGLKNGRVLLDGTPAQLGDADLAALYEAQPMPEAPRAARPVRLPEYA